LRHRLLIVPALVIAGFTTYAVEQAQTYTNSALRQ
jgi:hypothetical protein